MVDFGTNYILNTHNRASIYFDYGDGVYLFDKNGKKYLDFVAGIAVNSLGYGNKILIEAARSKIDKIWHLSNLYTNEDSEKLATFLCQKLGFSKAFFSNSGAESIEAAIKIARRKSFLDGDLARNKIIAFKKSFHGRTIATVSASGNENYIEGFEPRLQGFCQVEYGNIEAVKKAIDSTTCAILVEPVQGEGGVAFPGWNFLKEIKELCVQNDLLLILDEVQCGMGRTGKFYAHQWAEILPDILCSSKAIANGLPFGATLISKNLDHVIVPGNHGTTFGGNPLISVVALEVCKIISDEKFLEHVRSVSSFMHEMLGRLKDSFPKYILEVRGSGLLCGLRLSLEVKNSDVVIGLREKALLTTYALDNVLRFLPPLIISNENVLEAERILVSYFSNL